MGVQESWWVIYQAALARHQNGGLRGPSKPPKPPDSCKTFGAGSTEDEVCLLFLNEGAEDGCVVGRREKREQIRRTARGRAKVRMHYKTEELSRWEETRSLGIIERTPWNFYVPLHNSTRALISDKWTRALRGLDQAAVTLTFSARQPNQLKGFFDPGLRSFKHFRTCLIWKQEQAHTVFNSQSSEHWNRLSRVKE